MAQNTSNTNSLFTVTQMNRASATLSSSTSATIDGANATYMAQVRDSNPYEEQGHIECNQSEETEQLHGTRDDAVTESCRRKESVIYDGLKGYTEPTVCTQDCTMTVNQDCKPRTIFDYEAAILRHLVSLRIHLEVKNTAVWTRKELDEDGKRQKKKPYQVEEPKVNEGEETEAAKKKKNYWEGKESMDVNDELLEKLYDDLPKLLDELQKWISKESYLYYLLSTRNQFWPSIRSLSRDPIIDELKEVIADKVGTLDLADVKQIANRRGSILFRCKDKMFKNCFEVFHFHGKELTDLINTLLDLKLGEVEPPQAKRKRLSEEEEIQNEVVSNLKNVAQSTTMLVEDILKELGRLLSINLVPLTYGQLEQALGKDIRPILREFLMNPTQTVENTVRELVQLSNNRYILPRTPDTTLLLVALREPITWSTIIFDWLAEKRTYFSAAMPVARMEEPQDSQITSYDDDLSIYKTTDTSTANVCRLEPEDEDDDDSLQYYSSDSQLRNPVSSINRTISPLSANEWEKPSGNVNLDTTSCSNETTSPFTKEIDALINWLKYGTWEDRVPQPPSSTGDATACPSLSEVMEVLDLDTD